MKNLIKKVDNIASIEQALILEELGADILVVPLDDVQDRIAKHLKKEELEMLMKKLKKSKLGGEISRYTDFDNALSLIDEIGFDYVQVSGNEIPPLSFRRELIKRKIAIIYAGIQASYDEDPSWILDNYENQPDLNASFYQIDLLGNIEDSWRSLKYESPKYDTELQVEDINSIGKRQPLIITLDFTIDNIWDIINEINSIKGICMTVMNGGSIRNDVHRFDYSAVLKILTTLSTGNTSMR